MKNITASVANTQNEKIRLRIGDKLENRYGFYVQDREWGTGVSLEGVYVGRRWFVLECYSRWMVDNGSCRGTVYTAYDITSEADLSDILSICERVGVEPPKKIVAIEA